jgi:MSHA biogenesis protein MshP
LQKGFAAIAAIFLVVILAALGAFMVSFSNTQHLTSAQDIQGSRAYWAARAGLEWGIASVTTVCPPTFPASLSVEGFTVTVTCTASAYTDSGAISLFDITAVAKSAGNVGSPGYIERSLTASMER